MVDLDELRRLRRARDRMDREFARPLDVAALARTALMSSAHFSRRFRDTYGETPYAYLMTRRIERAAALLRGGEVIDRLSILDLKARFAPEGPARAHVIAERERLRDALDTRDVELRLTGLFGHTGAGTGGHGPGAMANELWTMWRMLSVLSLRRL